MTNEEVKMTREEKFINAFLQVFENKSEVFELWGAVDDLDNLDKTISQMADKSNQEVVKVIGDWCKKYPKITDEIRSLLDRKWEPTPTKQEGQEPMRDNHNIELPEYLNLKNLKKRLPNSQSPR